VATSSTIPPTRCYPDALGFLFLTNKVFAYYGDLMPLLEEGPCVAPRQHGIPTTSTGRRRLKQALVMCPRSRYIGHELDVLIELGEQLCKVSGFRLHLICTSPWPPSCPTLISGSFGEHPLAARKLFGETPLRKVASSLTE
jgi:hypothetical protein